MKAIRRLVVVLGVVLTGVAGGAAAGATVNGDATISATDPVFGQITVGTSNIYAGAVSSIRWGNKEFINNFDHGRQLQLNSQFFNRFECYNPYEAGSFDDGSFSKTSSQLLSLTASGNVLDSTTQMAWYLPYHESIDPNDFCGDPAYWLPCPKYTGPLSDYRVHKTITIGARNIPNVIEYLIEQYVPEPILKGINNVTAVLPYDFSAIWSYDVVSTDYRPIRELSGEDDLIKVAATPDGKYAMGFYATELLQPYNDPGTADFWRVVPPDPFYKDPKNPSQPDPNFACVHIGSVNRYDSFNGPGYTYDRSYLVIGSLAQVKTGLANLHLQFRTLDPDVYNWRDYVTINGLSSLTTQEAAQNHWLSQGIKQGLRGSKTFSAAQYLQSNPDIAGAYGATSYQAAIEHYVANGRVEGRATSAKIAAGMQHLTGVVDRKTAVAGQNAYGQKADGTQSSSATPSNLNLGAVTEIASGDYTTLAVKGDGTLWVWGSNRYGARGDGTNSEAIVAPVQVPIPARITTPSRPGKHAIAVGTSALAAIDTAGQVWTWGANWNGRLGDGTTNSRYTPARVRKSAVPGDYLTGIVSIAAGGGTMAAIDADGMVWTWGAGASGALGNGGTSDSAYPVQVLQAGRNNTATPFVGVSQVACGSSGFCIALTRYGKVFGWGNNDFAQLAIAPGGSYSIATPLDIGPNVAIDAIAAGAAHGLAHSSVDGKVYGWGYNGRGQLGTGSPGVAQFPAVAMTPGPDGMNNISELAAGANFSAMVRYSDRAVFVAGDNQSGQLAVPSTAPAQYLPVRSTLVP